MPSSPAETETSDAAAAADGATNPGLPETIWAALSAPFPAEDIELLPKQLVKNEQGQPRQPQFHCKPDHADLGKASVDGLVCGGYHARSVHLHYIGHAGVTTRLNEVVGPDGWDWQPLYMDPTNLQSRLLEKAVESGNTGLVRMLLDEVEKTGTPRYSDDGLWIKLTVAGVTKLAFGDAQGKRGANATKEIIGDAIRNGALRFGVATYLWSKSTKAETLKMQHGGDDDSTGAPTASRQGPALPNESEVKEAIAQAVKDLDMEQIREVYRKFGGQETLQRMPAPGGGDSYTYYDVVVETGRRIEAETAQQAAEQPEGTPTAEQFQKTLDGVVGKAKDGDAKGAVEALDGLIVQFGESILSRVEVISKNGPITAWEAVQRLRAAYTAPAPAATDEAQQQPAAPATETASEAPAAPAPPKESPRPRGTTEDTVKPVSQPVRADWLDELEVQAEARGMSVEDHLGEMLTLRNQALSDVPASVVKAWAQMKRDDAVAAFREAGLDDEAHRLESCAKNSAAVRAYVTQ